MRRSPVVAALVLSLAACSETPSGPIGSGGGTYVPPTESEQSLTGLVIVGSADVYLRVSSNMVRLNGPEARVMRTVAGLDVEVRGQIDMNGGFSVRRFLVRGLNGQSAADGILVAAGNSYALKLADGTLRAIVDPPAALVARIGNRVWVAGDANASPTAFGVISAI